MQSDCIKIISDIIVDALWPLKTPLRRTHRGETPLNYFQTLEIKKPTL